jgi:hypothetical protein
MICRRACVVPRPPSLRARAPFRGGFVILFCPTHPPAEACFQHSGLRAFVVACVSE